MSKSRFVFAAGHAREWQHAYFGSGPKVATLAADSNYVEIPADAPPPTDTEKPPLWNDVAQNWTTPPLTQDEEDDKDVKQKLWRWRYLMTKRARGGTWTTQEANWMQKAETVLERLSNG